MPVAQDQVATGLLSRIRDLVDYATASKACQSPKCGHKPGGGSSVETGSPSDPRAPPSADFFLAGKTSRTGFSRLCMKHPKSTPGRPPHHPTDMQRRLVQTLASQGIPQAETCRVLDVSAKTLRKRYRRELDIGAAKLEAVLIGHLLRLAAGDDDVALRAIIFILRCRFGWSQFAPAR